LASMVSFDDPATTHGHDIVVIGASAGGLEAITALLQQFGPEFPAAVFVVCHLMPDGSNHLVDIFNTAGPLVAREAADNDEFEHGIVHVAPADRHLLVKQGYMRVTRGPRENRWRPAIDPLFRSAAVAYGPRVVGVVLSGMLDDGTAGLVAIKRCGGITIVQDPDEAAFPDMPRTALANVKIDHCLPIAEIGALIRKLASEPAPKPVGTPPNDLEAEVRITETGYSDPDMTARIGELTALSCPECGGPIWQQEIGESARYRCRVGHAYSESSLLSGQAEAIEASIWAAIRLLEQRANVLTGLAHNDRKQQRMRLVEHQERLAKEARDHAAVLRKLLVAQPQAEARARL
jgi:two-component system, chemotaxis family, protein-glutamate methylesterase/glutaminase